MCKSFVHSKIGKQVVISLVIQQIHHLLKLDYEFDMILATVEGNAE